jgi:hypothetical protein
MNRRKEFMAKLRQTDRHNLGTVSDRQWRWYKARVKKPDVSPEDQKNWQRWQVRDKIRQGISRAEGVPLDWLKKRWHDMSAAKKAENPSYYRMMKWEHPAGKAYYDELVTQMTGLTPKVYTHKDERVLPGVFRGVHFADPNEIRAERQKWKALTLRHLGATDGLGQWDLAKRARPDEDEQFVRQSIIRIARIRKEPFKYTNKRGELKNFGLKHIDPYKYYSARASEATGIPRDSRAFQIDFRKPAEKLDIALQRAQGQGVQLGPDEEVLAEMDSRRLRPSMQDADGFDPVRRQTPSPPWLPSSDEEEEDIDPEEVDLYRFRRGDPM